MTYLGSNLSETEKQEIGQVIRKNKDLFAWRPTDMPGIDPNFLCHKLSVCREAKPIAQRKRKAGEERKKAIEEEVSKLIDAGFIREVQYTTWLANVVMVRKPNDKWRICTDYTDLNKACPKDAYPLLNIDRLVNGAACHQFLTFLDAYSGYNQIRMHPRDEEKTTFVTESANYCYQVMPFGLKNVGATYQRLMDRIFHKQIGKNLEVYVDDMVVKSPNLVNHTADLAEVFQALRKHRMRLNPDKCVFGVSGGKFLGFMLSNRGIEVNPDKCHTILDMRSPTNIKEVQRLSGQLTSLSRFLPCMAEIAKPILNLLKKADRFKWTDECEAAFQHFKGQLGTPPVLSKPILGSNLIIYLAVSNDAVSAVMIQERLLRAGYYWPTLKTDCAEYVKKCKQCQQHGNLIHASTEKLHSISAPWPFSLWGIDILGPFPLAKGQCKFLVVAVDYFTKWIEADPLTTITAANVQKFVWKNIITRFGIPYAIISDNRLQFTDKKFNTFLENLGIRHRFTSVEHPQSNGQAEAANKVVLTELKKRLGSAKGAWAEELPKVLKAYRCTPQSNTKETPFRLAYGTDAMIPVEVGEPSF
uniref:Transposon Ty3-I Gag-Pol polyprotein n=1 Tax=Cajanus cajan TaxID=3821 RepID=A0A151UA33_CAJCA|nr:Transposon Ty3-I Gag-Pol polyprotein [Cajanus cajan]